jgi:hypothetical protein
MQLPLVVVQRKILKQIAQSASPFLDRSERRTLARTQGAKSGACKENVSAR